MTDPKSEKAYLIFDVPEGKAPDTWKMHAAGALMDGATQAGHSPAYKAGMNKMADSARLLRLGELEEVKRSRVAEMLAKSGSPRNDADVDCWEAGWDAAIAALKERLEK